MNWKQPIPTNLDETFGEDYLSMNLYIHLLLNSANRDGFWTDEQTKRTFTIKRGEVIFGRNKWANKICASAKTVERVLHKISKIYQKVTYSAEQGFTRVSILNYDEITDMTYWRPTGDPLVTTSKNVKNVKKEINTKVFTKKDPLTQQQLWKIALDLNIPFWYVEEKHKSVMAEVEAGSDSKYKIKSVYLTTRNWCSMGKEKGFVEEMNSSERAIAELKIKEQK